MSEMTSSLAVLLLLSACPAGDDAVPADTGEAKSEVKELARLVLDGYCPVTVVDGNRWQKGDERFSAVHGGCRYWFAGEDEKKAFLKAPESYLVVAEGHDIVRYVDTGILVEGRRNFGVFMDGIYLLANAESRARFENDPQRYTDAAKELTKLANDTGYSLRERALSQSRELTAETAIKQFDRDQNKHLDASEISASMEVVRLLASAFDTDGDGALSEIELAAAIERLRSRRERAAE
jgi:YHS domain-containing protein